jgi:hypothetical protein
VKRDWPQKTQSTQKEQFGISPAKAQRRKGFGREIRFQTWRLRAFARDNPVSFFAPFAFFAANSQS